MKEGLKLFKRSIISTRPGTINPKYTFNLEQVTLMLKIASGNDVSENAEERAEEEIKIFGTNNNW
jgi:hypothetical protein